MRWLVIMAPIIYTVVLLGFDKKIWQTTLTQTGDSASVSLYYRSLDGEEGYPGNLDVTVCYTLTSTNELQVDLHAVTNKTTVVNLTNHSYFNLRGYGSCCDHLLELLADYYLPTDKKAIPTGALEFVGGTPMDFRVAKRIGQEIDSTVSQLVQAFGYDHNWVINDTADSGLVFFARVTEPETGRVMEVCTTQPGVQFYTGNYLAGEPGKAGVIYNNRDGFCLETQHFPDSPNWQQFPSTLLYPDEHYQHRTVFRFSANE